MADPHNNGAQDTLPCPQITEIPNELGKCIVQDALLARDVVWEGFVR